MMFTPYRGAIPLLSHIKKDFLGSEKDFSVYSGELWFGVGYRHYSRSGK